MLYSCECKQGNGYKRNVSRKRNNKWETAKPCNTDTALLEVTGTRAFNGSRFMSFCLFFLLSFIPSYHLWGVIKRGLCLYNINSQVIFPNLYKHKRVGLLQTPAIQLGAMVLEGIHMPIHSNCGVPGLKACSINIYQSTDCPDWNPWMGPAQSLDQCSKIAKWSDWSKTSNFGIRIRGWVQSLFKNMK